MKLDRVSFGISVVLMLCVVVLNLYLFLLKDKTLTWQIGHTISLFLAQVALKSSNCLFCVTSSLKPTDIMV